MAIHQLNGVRVRYAFWPIRIPTPRWLDEHSRLDRVWGWLRYYGLIRGQRIADDLGEDER